MITNTKRYNSLYKIKKYIYTSGDHHREREKEEKIESVPFVIEQKVVLLSYKLDLFSYFLLGCCYCQFFF